MEILRNIYERVNDMKRLFLSVLVVTMAIVNVAATKRALIIGIGDYP